MKVPEYMYCSLQELGIGTYNNVATVSTIELIFSSILVQLLPVGFFSFRSNKLAT